MTAGGFRHEPFDCRGATEWILVHGGNDSPQVLLIPPLFEEMNYLRRFIVDIAHALAAQGIGSWLPDLPGTGESLRHLRDIDWEDWRGAVRAVGKAIGSRVGTLPHVASFRGGTLLGDAVEARSWWSYAPATGASLLRHLRRTQLISDLENHRQNIVEQTEIASFCGGYELSFAMREALSVAVELPVNGPRRAIPAGPGTPLWRRSEPGRDPELSALLAHDITLWIAACDGR